jgi:YHS domain-containing protein
MYSRYFLLSGIAALGFVLLFIGCSSSDAPIASKTPPQAANTPTTEVAKTASTDDPAHGHEKGSHGGIIVSLGRDSYHIEAIVTKSGELRLYTLGNDESRVIEVAAQKLRGFVKLASGGDSSPLEITPQPQSGDTEGKTSLFVAQLPSSLVGQTIEVTIPNITIGDERFRLGFSTEAEPHNAHSDSAMPAKATDDAERELYLTAGGIYTQADIEANGKLTASQKFANFESKHDLKPKTGDKICPVTLTKANSECTWIVGGKTYEFCCPPCVDEFVLLAKTKPEEIKAPETYIKQ